MSVRTAREPPPPPAGRHRSKASLGKVRHGMRMAGIWACIRASYRLLVINANCVTNS